MSEDAKILENQSVWYKDKFFLFFYCIQLVAVFIAVWFLFGPIFKITFENGSEPYYWWTQALLCFSLLLPFWFFQILGLVVSNKTSLVKRILITLGSYLNGLGGIVALGVSFEKRTSASSKGVSLRTIAIVTILIFLVTLAEVLFVDFIMSLIKYINAV